MEAGAANPTCPSYNLFANLMTDICWTCMFPITIAGVQTGPGSKPLGAAPPRPTCSCQDQNGFPQFGFQYSQWEPARVVEVVKSPYCSPILDTTLQVTNSRRMGGLNSNTNAHDTTDSVFYHYHYYAFPLGVMLNLFSGCASDGYMNFDMMYMSELDPTWNGDELAFYTNPEVVLVANPVAQAACIGDALAANVGAATEKMFWCAGTWGSLYPFSGNVATNGSPPRDTSLIVARALASLHRRGLAWKTMGSDAMCNGYIYPTLPKTQYKSSQLYPVAEANSSHWIGESTFLWGEWRNIPAVGEDFVHMIWRWNDCCVPFF